MKREFKRYVIWIDHTLWRKTAVEAGLVYGVYDRSLDSQIFPEKEFGVITSRERALEVAGILNDRLTDPFDY